MVSVATLANFTSTTKKHIPDAVLLDSASDLYLTREEGLGPTGSMMLGGPQMDALVKKLGIDGSTTIVLTIPRGSSDSDHYQPSVAYWTFRYWGFSRDRVKILNGGDDAWDVAGRPLTDALLVPTPSTFSVTANKIAEGHPRTLGRRDAGGRRLDQQGPQRAQHLADARRARLRHHRPTSRTPTAAAAGSSSSPTA